MPINKKYGTIPFKDASQKEIKVKFPLLNEIYVNGQLDSERRFSEVKFNSALSDKLFEKPPGKPFRPNGN
jgi:hypothetical protein